MLVIYTPIVLVLDNVTCVRVLGVYVCLCLRVVLDACVRVCVCVCLRVCMGIYV